jgi:hypothetical protein
MDGAIGISHKPPPKSSPGRGGLKKSRGLRKIAVKVSPPTGGGDLEGAQTAITYLNAKQYDFLRCQQNRPYNLFHH